MGHDRSTALNVAPVSLVRADAGLAQAEAQRVTSPAPPPRAVFAEIETVGSGVGSLADLAEQALRLMSDQADPVVDILVAMRVSLTKVQHELDAILGLEGVVDMARPSPNSYPRSGRRHSPPCPLTSREIEILICLADGKVYKEIALELSLTTSTVRSHLHHIYHKLGVADRAQAVLLATRRGWI
jgi:DNA-binding NarL/FixJ family response regulator